MEPRSLPHLISSLVTGKSKWIRLLNCSPHLPVSMLGFYACVHMSFRLTNMPVTFQHLMESCLGELHLNWCIIYLDDIIIFSKTPKGHLQRLCGVFEKLATAGLKLKSSKCKFFKTCISYLGHIVSEKVIETDPKKVEAIHSWSKRSIVTEFAAF